MNISISQSSPIRLYPRQIAYYLLNNNLPAYDSNFSLAVRIANQYGKISKLIAHIIIVATLSMAIFRILDNQLWDLTGLPNLAKTLLILLTARTGAASMSLSCTSPYNLAMKSIF